MERTSFGQSFIVPTCISPSAGHITTVDQFVDFFGGVEVITQDATVILRITILVTINAQDAAIFELLTDQRTSAHLV